MMEEHLLSTGNFSEEELDMMWMKNPPCKPNRPLESGDCWEDEEGYMHYVDSGGVERYLPKPTKKGE